MKSRKTVPEIINNTSLTREEIEARPLIGRERNLWRQRNVNLYEGHAADYVYAIGMTFDRETIIITQEPRNVFATALSYWRNGEKTYVSE